jgi:RNA polymerase sigma factor (sigma-70 family)
MAPEPLRSLLRGLRRLGECAGVALSDAELLERFVRQRDEAAFEVLVWRHGPLVLGVCRRLLRHEPDVEDAFQATFLALVRKAHTIVRRESVSAWLYRVAYRVALAARAAASERTAREQPWADQRAATEPDEVLWRDLRPVLDAEVMRLPEKYRAPFVLCCLEGKTNEEAAAQLGCPRGTVLSRLARARERLRGRLARRGVTLSAAALAAAAGERGLAALPAGLAELTIRAVPKGAAGAAAAAGVSARVAALAEGVLQAMFMNRLKTVLLVLLVLTLTGVGAGLLAAGMLPGEAGGTPQAGASAPPSQEGAGAPAGGAEKQNPVEEARLRRKSADNLKQIGLALHNYHDTYKGFPAPAIYSGGLSMPGGRGPGSPPNSSSSSSSGGELPMPGGIGPTAPGGAPTGPAAGAEGPGTTPGGPAVPGAGGKPLLSWRVALLPYLEQGALYRQFKLDEPWDSPHNKKLLAKIPAIYAPVRGPSRVEGGTYYQAFVGQGAGFEPHQMLRLTSFLDGTSNTILVVEAARPVPWTKPEDLPFVPDQALPALGGQFHGHFFALFADADVKLISRNADEEMLRRAITRADGLPIDFTKLLAPQTRRPGTIDLDLLPEEVVRLKDALKKARAEVEQAQEQLAVLQDKLWELRPRTTDPKTKKLIEEHTRLQFDLERTLQVLDALRRQAQQMRQELERSRKNP